MTPDPEFDEIIPPVDNPAFDPEIWKQTDWPSPVPPEIPDEPVIVWQGEDVR